VSFLSGMVKIKVSDCNLSCRALYPDLPNGLTIKTEPIHMTHGLLVSFVSATGQKRRQRHSMPDQASAMSLMQSIRTQSAKVNALSSQRNPDGEGATRVDEDALPSRLVPAAQHLSLKVLRDSLMSGYATPHGTELEGPEGDSTPKAAKPLGKWTMSSAQARYGAKEAFKPTLSSPYAQSTPMKKPRTTPRGDESKERPANNVLTGKDLVLICRQNSLIPVVLGLACKDRNRIRGNTNYETEQIPYQRSSVGPQLRL